MEDTDVKVADAIGLTAIVLCSFAAGAIKGNADKKGIPLYNAAILVGPTAVNGLAGFVVGASCESSVGKRAAIYATTAAVCTAAGYFVGNALG